MKDFYSTQASPPRQNKLVTKQDYYDCGISLKEKAIHQSNLLKQQFYNNLDFPKNDEIVKQIRNRSNRILSYSMITDDVQSIIKEIAPQQEKQIIQDCMRIKTQSQSSQICHIEKQSADIIRSKSTNNNVNNPKQKQSQQCQKQQSPSQQQNDLSNLEFFSNIETDNKQKNNQFTNTNSDEKIIKKRSSLLLPKFDNIPVLTPQDYKVSTQNMHLIHSYKHKKRDRSLQRNYDQKYGSLHVQNTDFSQPKLPSLKDSFADLIQNHFKFHQIQRQNISPLKNEVIGENILNSQIQSNNGGTSNKHNNEFISKEGEPQKRINSSDRKLAVMKLLRNKIRIRQKNLSVNEIIIQNELNISSTKGQEYDQLEIKNANQPTESNQQIQKPSKQLRDLGIINGQIRNQNDVNDKDLLSKLLMKQQSLKLQEIKMFNQIKFEQSPATPAKLIHQTSNQQKYRIQLQQKNNNLHPLEQIHVDQSLVIKKNQNSFVYPQLDVNQNSQMITTQKKQIYSPKQIYKNPFPKDDDTFKNCQSFINKLLKKRYNQQKIIQKKVNLLENSQENKEPQNIENIYNSQNTSKRPSFQQIENEKINKVKNIEKINEEQLNNDFENLQKYYDEKYEQSGRALLSSSESNFKFINIQQLENTSNRNQEQTESKEDFYSSNQKKRKNQKQNNYSSKKYYFNDLQPWDEVEQDEVSLSFFHKTIYDPIKNMQHQRRHFQKEKEITQNNKL